MTQGELWPSAATPAVLAPRVQVVRLEQRVCWDAPHGVLPLVEDEAMRLRPRLRIETAVDLLVALDVLRSHGLAQHPEVTRQALVELATDPEHHGRQSRKYSWMTMHRGSAMRFAVRRYGVHKVAHEARLHASTVYIIAARGLDSDISELWDGTIWGPAHRDTAQGDPLRATRQGSLHHR